MLQHHCPLPQLMLLERPPENGGWHHYLPCWMGLADNFETPIACMVYTIVSFKNTIQLVLKWNLQCECYLIQSSICTFYRLQKLRA